MPSNFWNSPTVEPKRNFRFLFSISPVPDVEWMVKSVEKPKYNISSTAHQFINHTFNYPGRLVWSPIAVTLVDPASPVDATAMINQFVTAAGYKHPGTGDAMANSQSNMEKGLAVGSLRQVMIRQIGAGGVYLDEWKLFNAWIQGDVSFGTLAYDNEDLTTITFTLTYDWAQLKTSTQQTQVATAVAEAAEASLTPTAAAAQKGATPGPQGGIAGGSMVG